VLVQIYEFYPNLTVLKLFSQFPVLWLDEYLNGKYTAGDDEDVLGKEFTTNTKLQFDTVCLCWLFKTLHELLVKKIPSRLFYSWSTGKLFIPGLI